MPSSSRQIVHPATYMRTLSGAASTRMQRLIWVSTFTTLPNNNRLAHLSCLTQFGAESLPTLALLTFLVLQFLFNIVRFLPLQSLRLWVDRSRSLWKILLDVSWVLYLCPLEHSPLRLFVGV
jgi:hypothetical protein